MGEGAKNGNKVSCQCKTRYECTHPPWPLACADLEMIVEVILAEEYYGDLKQLVSMAKNGEKVSTFCRTFTVKEDCVAPSEEEVELVKDGANVVVDNGNLPEYLEACLKYHVLERVKPQLNELLLGFFDVLHEPLLTVFDFDEVDVWATQRPSGSFISLAYRKEFHRSETECGSRSLRIFVGVDDWSMFVAYTKKVSTLVKYNFQNWRVFW